MSDVEKVKCRRCGKKKPLTERCFKRTRYTHKSGAAVDFFSKVCWVCFGAKIAASHARKRQEKIANEGPEKKCSVCRKKKPTTRFYRDNENGLLQQPCRDCRNIRISTYKRSAQYAAWKRANRARNAEVKRAHRARNAERIKAKRAEWDAVNNTAERKLLKKAHDILHTAVKKGLVEKPTHCARCDSTTNLMAYMPQGIKNPMVAQWLCQVHHIAARHEKEHREEQREASDGTDPIAALTIDPVEWLAIHEKHKAAHALREQRWASAVAGSTDRKGELARKRAAFLVFGCGYNSSEAKDIMSREGWDGPTAPLEPVLGHWVPT